MQLSPKLSKQWVDFWVAKLDGFPLVEGEPDVGWEADSEWHLSGSMESWGQGCQMAKFDPFLSLDCARVEGVGRNPRKRRGQILQRGVAEP